MEQARAATEDPDDAAISFSGCPGVPCTTPLLKWPGGKRGELATILSALPPSIERYIEPFVGGGAVLFALPANVPAVVGDVSTDLMDLYGCVQRQDREFLELVTDLDVWWRSLDAYGGDTGAPLCALFTAASSDDALGSGASSLLTEARPDLAAVVPPIWHSVEAAFLARAGEDVPRKLLRMRAVQRGKGRPLPAHDVARNVEGAFKAACYTALRGAYNDGLLAGERSPRQAALFLFLREYAYAAMFRFNRRGAFNVPYGGISYNRKRLAARVHHLTSPSVVARLRSTELHCADFVDVVATARPGPDDFVFLDPPYDSDFSDYDRTAFGVGDHARLAALMRQLPCRFQLVIKATSWVQEVYRDPRWHVAAFDKTYRWTIKDRNDRSATHLVVTNYRPGAERRVADQTLPLW